MTRALFRGTLGAVLAVSAVAQSTTAPPQFEIADVHASGSSANQRMRGGVLVGDLYIIRNATIVDLIRAAYGITDRATIGADDNSRIVGGPSWLDLDRFDVIARSPSSTSAETARSMLQTLLANRFGLVVHMDTKLLPGFALSAGKGKPKLREADGSGEIGCRSKPGDPAYFEFVCRNMTLQAFAEELRNMSYALNNPVADNSGIKGSWDFDLKWRGPESLTIFDAIDHQLGLKLEPQKVPRPVVVVDSVNRRPTPNALGVEARVPQPPRNFELAVIKPSMPGEKTRPRLQSGGRLDLQAFTLRQMINVAWSINNDQFLAGAPKFLDSARFDLTAKATTSAMGVPDTIPLDVEDIRPMLRELLTERFRLATHIEDRRVSAYRLVAAKPKLRTADPSGRTGCNEGPGADGKDPRIVSPQLARLVTCQNITMTEFADQLPYRAGGYVNTPVVNATGIEGRFDLTLNFTPQALLQSANQPPAGGAAADPNGMLSLFDALAKQLGLKLETEERLMPVLVIDHVDEKPTDN